MASLLSVTLYSGAIQNRHCALASTEDDLYSGFQGGAIDLVESAEGFAHEAFGEGGEDPLDGGQLQ